MDKTYIWESKVIDSIIMEPELMNYIKDCHLVEINDIIIIDYRAYIIDVSIIEYFGEIFSKWDKINRRISNLSRQSY